MQQLSEDPIGSVAVDVPPRPAAKTGPRDRNPGSAFIPAVISLLVVFATVGATVPMFNLYRSDEGFTNGDISLTVVAYSVFTLGTLLTFGRLSHHVGRRPVALASLLFLAAGALVLLDVHHLGVLIAGRVLMGVGAGLASSSLTSYIVDAAPAEPAWLASVASSQTVMIGLAVGAVFSGALIQFGPWPRDLVFLVLIALLVISMVLIAVSPETAERTPGARRSLRPRVSLPAHVKPLLGVAAAVLLATWSIGSFYQAFVPALIEDDLHSSSSLVLGLIFAAYMAPSALGAPLIGRFEPATGQRIGMLTFLAGIVGLIAAVAAGGLELFLAATIAAGAGQGIAISATTRGLLHGSTLNHRASIFSAVYLLSYAGATIPALIAGSLTKILTLPQIVTGYGALALAGTLITLVAAKNPTDLSTPKVERSERSTTT
jgi:MFS family permease